MKAQVLLSVFIVSLFAFQTPVLGHSERETTFPDGHGEVPEYRPFDPNTPFLVVCKSDSAARIATFPPGSVRSFNEFLLPYCAYAHIQAAVDAVTTAGTNIYVLPGLYHEEPSRAEPTGHCAEVAAKKKPLSYEDQYACPAVENLIAVFGHVPASTADPNAPCTTEPLCRLQIEGTGLQPEDVTIDAQWQRLNGIRADRADGVYIRNLLTERTDFNGIYVLETDGFVLEKVVGRFNYEYGILTFAVDHGLIFDCETYLNGDSGVYPGSAADLHGVDPHPAVEIHHCDSHHNALGYSGTAGNSVYAHHNRFHHNSAGVSMDSFFPGHPGLPQDSSLFEHNWIYANNVNYYDNYYGYNGKEEVCKKRLHERDVEEGFVCPVVPVPVGTGILVAGGNDNLFRDNWVWDNHRYGMMLFT
ncbi:MAG: right-handed parallel beta-helix repeat-containing protein, partial [Euryarchaeota archaeon]|nr:right-handed parallel beta-helix repeat-containing protein [Euryarchaeota archaeon]